MSAGSLGNAEVTICWWKKQFTGAEIAEIGRLKQLEDETRKLVQAVADLTLDKIEALDAYQGCN
jgi:hypothetical protein